jgi:hypothetical protein
MNRIIKFGVMQIVPLILMAITTLTTDDPEVIMTLGFLHLSAILVEIKDIIDK